MELKDIMTMQEVQEMKNQLEKVFSIVRLLDGETLETGAGIEPPCQCYSVWGKSGQCINCISRKALKEKRQKTKIEIVDSKVYQVIARYLNIDGKPYIMEMINNLEDDDIIDSEDRENLLAELSGYADELYKDALTGVFNRRYYEDKVKELESSAGVAMVDLDDFKLYNDTYGHDAGDKALKAVVEVINRHVRKTDKVVRFGGDEFLLLIPDINVDNFTRKLKEIQEEVHAARVPGYSQLKLSVSIGGVLSTGEKLGEAVLRADKFMYRAKQRKNMVVISENEIVGRNSAQEILLQDKTKLTILIVDDSEMNRCILSEMLKEDYDILEATNGEEAIKLLRQYETGISLVLLDLVMPVLDGFGVLSDMTERNWLEDIPVIMISGVDSFSYVRRAFDLGVADYIKKPFDAQIVYKRVYNTITLYAKQRRLLVLVTDQIYEKEKNNRMMISILSQIVEFRNGESGAHVLHINIITELILERLIQKTDQYDLSSSVRRMIVTASALHDIGKIGIDDKILNKPGRLTKEEFEVIKTHSAIGASMLESLEYYKNEPLVRIAHDICRWHHERYDGKGYPDGLKGEEIPISAQVVALADVYDALISERVYKKAYSHEKAVEMILNGECGTFNPLLLECLKEISPQLSRTFKKEKDDNREYYEAQRISEEILRQNALPRKDHSQRVIEIMQEKIKFFKENSGKISMEYNAISGNLVLTDGESQKEYQRDNLEFDLYRAYDISEEDIQRVKDSLDSVSSKNKEVSIKVMLKVRGERQMCDLKLHTLWSSLKTDGYIGIVGQLDIVK